MFDLTVVKEKELPGAAHNVLNVAQRDCKIPKNRDDVSVTRFHTVRIRKGGKKKLLFPHYD